MKKSLIIFILIELFLFSVNVFADTTKVKPAVAVVDFQAKGDSEKNMLETIEKITSLITDKKLPTNRKYYIQGRKIDDYR